MKKRKDLLVIKSFRFRFKKKNLAGNMELRCCTIKKCKCYIKCNESRDIFQGNVRHNQVTDSEAFLNRQIFNNSVKRKAKGNLCKRPRKLIHKEPRSQDLDTLTYKDIGNISRNMHKAKAPPNCFLSQLILKNFMKH